jgi:hypothetical protein
MACKGLEEAVTGITLDTLQEFVINHGDVKIVDRSEKTRMLQPDVPDVIDLISKADRFFYEGRWHSREGFLKLLKNAEPKAEQ